MVGREKMEEVALEVALGSLGRMGSWKEPEWGCPVGEGRLLGPGFAKERKLWGGFLGASRRGAKGLAGLEAFPLPGERAPGCSWLLAGAIYLAAAGDLDAWHSRAARLFHSQPTPHRSLPCEQPGGEGRRKTGTKGDWDPQWRALL